MKHVVLYFGSFNPVHRGHIALAEWVAEHVGCDEVVLVVSPKNPLKADDSLAPELNRFEMAELACARSRFPERIKPSVIEFLLEKPSYTIDTLRYLSRNYGGQMRFSVLLGADLVPQLERWRDYREILDGYPLLVYPRRGFETTQYLDRITLLNEAPLCDFSSTEVRRALEQGDDASAMLTPEVLAYIREKRLWDPVRYAERLTERIGEEPCNAALLVERGRWYYRRQEWGKALNDFNRALGIDPARDEARQYAEQIEEILSICEVKPAVLQTELHPYHQEPELKAFLSENGMTAQAWYPLGHGDRALREEPLFAKLGEKYGKTSTQIILRWHIQAGNVVIPGSKNPEHIKSNFDLFDFELTADEMAQIAAMNQNKRYYTSTPELLKKYAEMVPPVDKQK